MNRVQTAVHRMAGAIAELKAAKRDLLAARNDQHVPLAAQIAAVEETYQALTDPGLTPEIQEGR